jgi:predicted transcriptional regulator
MATVDTLRNDLIDKLFSISNKEYLLALNKIIDNGVYQTNPVQLSEEQITMLKLSEKDIEAGNLITHDEVTKSDLQWLKEL